MFILLGPSTKKSINLSPPRKTYNTKLNNSLFTYNKLVRKNMDVSEHERLSNITLGYNCFRIASIKFKIRTRRSLYIDQREPHFRNSNDCFI
jgi:hypothetical protein